MIKKNVCRDGCHQPVPRKKVKMTPPAAQGHHCHNIVHLHTYANYMSIPGLIGVVV